LTGDIAMQGQKLLSLTSAILVLCFATAVLGEGKRPDLSKAKDTVDRVRKADPPPVKNNTVVQPIERPKPQMPRGGSDVERMRKKPPPSPPR
jgi:hypothetical protein